MVSIRDQVESNFPNLTAMSNEDLQATIGQIPLSSRLYDPEERLSLPSLAEAGRIFVQTNDRVRSVICEARARKLIGDALTVDNVTGLVNLLIPVFGLVASGAAVPAGVMALSVFVLKVGLGAYCQDYRAGSGESDRGDVGAG